MFDIGFFRDIFSVKNRIVSGKYSKADTSEIEKVFETNRRTLPQVFNVETTNICNMRCVMCPRTNLMTRKNSTMSREEFSAVLRQIKPHAPEQLEEFWRFIADKYGVQSEQRNENSFYFHVVARCLTLHGYGEPLLDSTVVEKVTAASEAGIPTYLSCVPANLTVERAEKLFAAGLTVLKVSIDALDDEKQKEIRGRQNNFTAAFKTVLRVLELKKAKGYRTLIVPTMISFSEDAEAREMHARFLEMWKDHDVFAYIKSQDNRWLFERDENLENKSHYESQYCEFPWTSLSVSVEGRVVPCTQDYDTQMILGDVKSQSLENIWNGPAYQEFRRWHLTGDFPKGHKCVEKCDQKKVFQYLRDRE